MLSGLGLSYGTLSPDFDPCVVSYTASVASDIDSITVTPFVAESHATVKVNDVAVSSGAASPSIPLTVGQNIISVVVTAQSGAMTTYSVTVTRISGDATLGGLEVEGAALSPDFSPSQLSYMAGAENSVTSIRVKPTVGIPTSTSTVNGASVASGSWSLPISLDVGSNTLTVIVTAENESQNTYTVVVAREGSSDATLSTLSLSEGSLVPPFVSETTSYSASVANNVESITVTPTVHESHATVEVNGAPVDSGTASQPVALNVGSNTVSIVVTAQNGAHNTYTVTVTRAGSADAALGALALSTGDLSPDFNPSTLTYTSSVPNVTASITVTPTVNEAHATVTPVLDSFKNEILTL
jgi:hypothetical protein